MAMYLAIDFGTKRIGLALGEIMPRGAGFVRTREEAVFEILDLCQREGVKKIILGVPIRNRGEEGNLADEIRRFGKRLSGKTGLPLVYEPEQFTSCEAERILKGRKYSRQSGRVDEMAAILLLEQYISSNPK